MADVLRIGIVGAGRAGRRHAGAVRAGAGRAGGARLVMVCDVERGAAEEVVGQDARAVGNVGAVVRSADVDAVVIATPHAEHFGQAMVAIAAGKHVLMEKPLGLTMEECEKVVEFAEAAGVTLMAGMTHRFDVRYREMRRRLRAGEIGKVTGARAELGLDVLKYVGREHWVYDGRAGGGARMSLGVQQIDMLRYLLGQVKGVERARCEVGHAWFHDGADGRMTATLMMEGGVRAEVVVSLVDGGRPGELVVVLGEKGEVRIEKQEASSRKQENSRSMPSGAPAPLGMAPVADLLSMARDGDPFVNQMAEFVRCARSGVEPESSGRDFLETMRVVLGIGNRAPTT